VSTLKLRSSGPGRLLCFDLENRPLAYWYDGETTSQITAFGWKWSDEEKVHTLLLTPTATTTATIGPAKRSTRRGARLLPRHPGLGRRRLRAQHPPPRPADPQLVAAPAQLDPLPPLLTTDTLRDYPKRKGLSASLENLAAMYDLGGEKFGMSQPMWEEANKLTPDGVALARKRVASDVLLQERLREKLLSLGLLGVPKVWRP
jgi:hypothetical protein